MSTTWKQVVLDTADAVREANGSTAKIPVGQLADKVRAGAGIPYEGENPLTIGQDGYSFPAKTLLKDGLQIVNGVNGEDLTDTAADQTAAVAELLKMVNRKVAENRGEGEYVWKKLTAENGEFLDYVVSSDTDAYPDGGTQDGNWYELLSQPVDLADELDLIASNIREGVDNFGVIGAMSEGVSGIDYGTVSVATAKKATVSVSHSLASTPTYVFLIPAKITTDPSVYSGVISTATQTMLFSGNQFILQGATQSKTASTITFSTGYSDIYFRMQTYYWFAVK